MILVEGLAMVLRFVRLPETVLVLAILLLFWFDFGAPLPPAQPPRRMPRINKRLTRGDSRSLRWRDWP